MDLIIPDWLVGQTGVSPLQKLIVSVLFEDLGPGQRMKINHDSIGFRLGVPPNVVQENVDQLETMGLLQLERPVLN